MNIIAESIIVGIYCVFIYLSFYILRKINFNLLLFILGFTKHFYAYFIKLHYLYCRYGITCIKYNKTDINYKFIYLLRDSLFEGFLFIIFGNILNLIIKNKYILFFILGVILHIIVDLLGFHTYFCKNICITSL